MIRKFFPSYLFCSVFPHAMLESRAMVTFLFSYAHMKGGGYVPNQSNCFSGGLYSTATLFHPFFIINSLPEHPLLPLHFNKQTQNRPVSRI